MAENSSSETQAQTQAQVELKPADTIQDVSKEEQAKIAELAKQINIEDTQSVLQYGSQSQKKISEFSDQILGQIRAKDTGETGQILTDLMLKVKDMDVDSLSDEDSFLSKIPLIGSLVKSSQKFIAQYDTLSEQIEKIVDELHKSRMMLLKDITLFDTLYAKNLDYFKELNQYILAGEMKLAELREKELPKYKEKAEKGNDPVDAQKYQDYIQLLNRFEKKLHDLKLTKMLSLQTGPQIRLIQNSNQVLVEKIQSSIINTIPLWKNQLVIAIGLQLPGRRRREPCAGVARRRAPVAPPTPARGRGEAGRGHRCLARAARAAGCAARVAGSPAPAGARAARAAAGAAGGPGRTGTALADRGGRPTAGPAFRRAGECHRRLRPAALAGAGSRHHRAGVRQRLAAGAAAAGAGHPLGTQCAGRGAGSHRQ
jgi:uncharacterized protein YaaN involved in tellurite resistance